MDPKKPTRSSGNSTLTISLPASLKEQIVRAAENDHRTTSNWCVARLTQIIESMERKTLVGFPPVQNVAENHEPSAAADAPRQKTVYPKAGRRKAK